MPTLHFNENKSKKEIKKNIKFTINMNVLFTAMHIFLSLNV